MRPWLCPSRNASRSASARRSGERDIRRKKPNAGGVGGLVALSINGTFYFPCYDNNGNIIVYVDEFGSTAAPFAYDAFGTSLGTYLLKICYLSLRFFSARLC